MAKPVRSIIWRTRGCAKSKSISPAPASTVGNSAAGNVDKVKRLRPARTVTLPSSTVKEISTPSGRLLQISTSFRAGTVISPSAPSLCTSMRPTSSTSRSVPVSDKRLPSKLINTLDKIGSVCRRSTTPATRFKGLISASRDTENFIRMISLVVASAYIT